MLVDFRAPQPLTDSLSFQSFTSGEPSLDQWLKLRALKNEHTGASRTFVVCVAERVVGYYSLAAGVVEHHDASAKIRRNMPSPIPAIVLGRLAIDRQWQGRGLGSSMLRDALLRVQAAAKHIGARVVFVHALSENAKRFYIRSGFRESPVSPMTLMLPISEIDAQLGE